MNTANTANTPNPARDQMLRRIQAALRDVPSTERPSDVPVPRKYLRADTAPREQIIERFIEHVGEYKATVRAVSADALPAAIASACAAQRVRRLVVPADVPREWLSGSGMDALELLEDSEEHPLSYAQLEASGGVLTGCALGIAQTGTIVLDDGPTQGRRAITLIPDYHLCVVWSDQIVGLVPEGIARLGEVVRGTRRPITFVSGPSATSDIELNRVEGVHGPRILDVLVATRSEGPE